MDHKSWNTLRDCELSVNSWQDTCIVFKPLHITSPVFDEHVILHVQTPTVLMIAWCRAIELASYPS